MYMYFLSYTVDNKIYNDIINIHPFKYVAEKADRGEFVTIIFWTKLTTEDLYESSRPKNILKKESAHGNF